MVWFARPVDAKEYQFKVSCFRIINDTVREIIDGDYDDIDNVYDIDEREFEFRRWGSEEWVNKEVFIDKTC
jgi:hypothetical protein